MAIKLTTDCETTNVLEGGFQNYENPSNRTNAISRTGIRFRNGSYSYLVHLESTDSTAQFGSRRAELTYNNRSASTDTTIRWYAVSWYFPAATNLTDSREHSIIQWHDRYSPDPDRSSSPPLSIHVKDRRLRVSMRWCTQTGTSGGPTGDYITTPSNIVIEPYYDLGPLPLDQWVDCVVYYDPKANNTGQCKIWLNDALVYQRLNLPNHYANSYFPYYKLGIYKWLWTGALVSPNIVEYNMDRIRVADLNSTYPDVAVPSASPNIPPVVFAGNAQELNNAVTSTTLTGTATDSDGTITSTLWTRLSGPNTPTIVSASSLSTSVTGMIPGLYIFQLAATDNLGSTSLSTVSVRVNLLPVINLSANVTSYVAGTSTINLVSTSTDPDGTVVSRQWTLVSGPNVPIITSPTSSNTTVTGITGGTYIFTLEATDNNGDSNDANISITVGISVNLKLFRKLQ